MKALRITNFNCSSVDARHPFLVAPRAPRCCRAATPAPGVVVRACSPPSAEDSRDVDDYQLKNDMKSVARTILEGKPLLRKEREEVLVEEARERFCGRLAVLGLGAVLLGERITGKGAVQALDHAVGVPLWEIEPLLAALVIALLVAALYPRRKQLAEEAAGAKKQLRDWLADAQVWVRRLACVSLASTIVVEVVTGKGALALLDIETGVETLTELEAGAAFIVMLLLTSADVKRI